MSVDTNLLQGLRHTLSRLFAPAPSRQITERVATGAAFAATPEPAPVEVPLPPCLPLNSAERDEVEMLARIRGALYSKEA